MENIQGILDRVVEKGYTRFIPNIDVDSLLAAGILARYVLEKGGSASISLNLGSIIDEQDTYHVLIGFSGLKDLPGNADLIDFDGENSISGRLVKYVEGRISDWVNLAKLAIITGQYRLLDHAEEGFKGVEKEIVEKLLDSEEVNTRFLFKLWGLGKKNVKELVYRTLYPYIPGVSGEIDKAEEIARNIPGIAGGESAKIFAQLLLKNIRGGLEEGKKILYRLIGNTYTIKMFSGIMLDSGEVLGSLLTYTSIGRDNPRDIALIPLTYKNLLHILLVYEEYIDIVASEASMALKQVLDSNDSIVETEYIVRPELLIDILYSIDKTELLGDKPLIVRNNGDEYTCVRELLRIGRSFREVTDLCDEKQICRVEQ